MLKRILAILLCAVLILCGTTACKPDNIQYPSEIVDPTQQPSKPAPAPNPQEGEEEKEETPEVALPENPEQEAPTQANPLAATDFIPSKEVASALKASGIIKPGKAVNDLKNRTITLYTAAGDPAFSYVNQEGKTITEWDWMKALAEQEGFMLKLHRKSAAVSLKSQRVALLAGQKLSLIQLRAEDLAAGLTLCSSAKDYLDMDAPTFGISKAVLKQSGHKLFAPMGQVKSLWYATALMPAETDPFTLSKEKNWTLDAFKTVYSHAASNNALPLRMEDELAWATLSGKSPLTLLEGKLDSNITAEATRETFAELQALRAALPTVALTADAAYDLKNKNAAMAFTDTPQTAEGATYRYAPLPARKAGSAGTVIYSGTFLGLPKYNTEEEHSLAALTFAELWCNRYSEARAGQLQALGTAGNDYVNYINMAEENGHLILRDPAIEEAAKPYLAGLNDKTYDWEKNYREIREAIDPLIDRHNLYY